MSETKSLGIVIPSSAGEKAMVTSEARQETLSRPSADKRGLRVVRVWFQNRRTDELEVGRIVYKNPELDHSLMQAIFNVWASSKNPADIDFLMATDATGRAVVSQKALYSFAYYHVQRATVNVLESLDEKKE